MRLVLVDRDGVLNEERLEGIRHPSELALIPGAAEGLRRLNRAGIPVALVTNQSAVGRGLMSLAELKAIQDRFEAALDAAGARLDLVLVAHDAPERAGPRRKPAPGMLLEALAWFAVAAEDAVMIGDDLRDLEAAAAAGCRRMLVRTGKGAKLAAAGIPQRLRPVQLCDSFAAAVDFLLGPS
ncbi:MAG TPA: HAD-IIIA family hydrolase [Alphaproteobacteria bacterium]|nr:HAD-IIIA family hydrolase [Alphaproteobacteria bacterium]